MIRPYSSIPSLAIIVFLGFTTNPPAGEMNFITGDPVCGEIANLGCLGGGAANHTFVQDQEDSEEFIDPESGGQGFHGQCLTCTLNGLPVAASECHPDCIQSFASAEEQAAWVAVLAAANASDVRGVLRSAQLIPHKAQINTSRRTVQILDCQNRIVANLPLGDMYAEAVQTYALGDAEQAL